MGINVRGQGKERKEEDQNILHTMFEYSIMKATKNYT
jgi:hypothetical protein